jgi:hypothetical protein
MKHLFVVKEDACFVRLISQGKHPAGLCINGATNMEAFCKAAIDAYDQILQNKERKKRFNSIMNE